MYIYIYINIYVYIHIYIYIRKAYLVVSVDSLDRDSTRDAFAWSPHLVGELLERGCTSRRRLYKREHKGNPKMLVFGGENSIPVGNIYINHLLQKYVKQT